MRSFEDGAAISVEPWRARPFPILRDLVVDRASLDRIIQTGGFITAPTGSAQYGPATIFSSGPLEVSTQGTTGPGGSVTSSANVADVNTSGDEVFTAEAVASTCTATQTGVSCSTTITNGTLRTSEGDPSVEGDDTVVQIPTNPEPNTTYTGQIESVGDDFTYIFNEQVTNPDGSITAYGAHQVLEGPTALGDLFIAKSESGVASDAAPPPVVPDARFPAALALAALALFAAATQLAPRRGSLA
jgi:hypothetical protein